MTPGRKSSTGTRWSSRHVRRTPLLLLSLCASVLLAACGGDDDNTPSDTTPPTVAITDSVSATTATGPVTFTFTFSEDVGSSFVTADVTATGGTKAALTKVSATSYTLVVTPTASTVGTINLNVAAGAFSDVAGNASTAAASASQAYDTTVPDTTPPTVAITDSVSGATATGDVTFTFTFSEDVGTSFITDDVTVTGGTKGAFAKSSATVYTLVVAPTASATGTINVNVAAGAFSDLAGNASTAAASASQAYDTRPPPSQVVFADDYAAGVSYVAFGGSTGAPTLDTVEHHSGTASLKVEVPATNYTGGALKAATAQDVSAFNALSFWVKASKAVTLNVTGIGNDGAGNEKYSAESREIAVTTAWTQHLIPLPVPAKAVDLTGLFHFAEGSEEGAYQLWFDDIQLQTLSAAAVGEADSTTIAWPGTLQVAVAATAQLSNADNTVTWGFPVDNGILKKVGYGWYTVTSSDPSKATVSTSGLVTGVAAGSTNISATFGSLGGVAGLTAVTVTGGLAVPATLPPVPTKAPGAEVYSLYSSVTGGYNGTVSDKSAKVDTWRTVWSGGAGGDPFGPITVGAGSASPRKYVLGTPPNHFVGIEFTGANLIDATAAGFDTLHVDIWTPDNTQNLQVVLTDFGANGAFDGGDDKTGIKTITPPELVAGQWMSFDLPLATAFPNLTTFGHLAQMQFVAPTAGGTHYVDNVYFYKAAGGGGGSAPPAAPTAPTAAAADVISLFSSAYTGGVAGGDYSGKVDTYHGDCFTGPPGAVSVANHTITGTSHVVKKYTMGAGTFGVIETIGNTGGTATPPDACFGGTQTGANLINATAMTHIHVDVWSPAGSGNFQIHLVNADGTSTIAGPGAAGGATGGQNYATGANTVAAGSWVSFDIALSTLGPPGAPAGLTKVGLVKLFTADAGTYFIDNVYFHK